MGSRALAPLRDEPLTGEGGLATLTGQTFFESVEACIDALTPKYKTIDNSSSPYQATGGECILVDMSAGDMDVIVPINGGDFCVSRLGASNTLTIIGTVNGTVDPKILFDGSTASMAKIVDDWRYV